MSSVYTDVGSASGIIAVVGACGYGIYRLLVHSHCRSSCCSRPFLDVYVNLDEKDGDGKLFVPFKPVSPKLPVPPPATRQDGNV